MTLVLKIMLLAAVIVAASLASKRLGHTVGGWLGGLPWIAGPIVIFVAVGIGPDFARVMVHAALSSLIGILFHCLAFAHLAVRRYSWWQCLAGAWLTYLLIGSLAGLIALPYWLNAVILWSSLPLARKALPKVPPALLPAVIPSSELLFRVVGAIILAVAVEASAASLNTFFAGLFLSMPIVGAIMPTFALALYGPPAAVRVLDGFLQGLMAFVGFFLVLAVGLGVLPTGLVILLAVAAALAITALQVFIARRHPRPRLAASYNQ
jgi:hypothetical protein